LMAAGVDVVNEEEAVEVIEWKAFDGAFVRADAVLLIYRTENGEMKRLKTPTSGVVTLDPAVKKGEKLKKGVVVAHIDECRHAIVIKDMCGACGKDLREKDGMAGQRVEPSLANVSMIHHVPELIVSDELAKKIGNRDRQLVLESRRLVLLVDLDQTLIHTTNHAFDLKDCADVVHYKLRGTDFYTKIRPYTHTFLRRMNELYEMHIISYGERQYAHKIAEILDPDKRYFGHRILSRDELFSAMYKTGNMKALFPCGDQLIAIIDDRPDVWQYSDALIQVKPYRFFKETGDINAPTVCNAQQRSLVQERIAQVNVEGDGDETLEFIATVLTRVHTTFYAHYDKNMSDRVQDVKLVIAYMRSQVLRGCSIVLSGIVPIGMDVRNTEAFHLCIQFGATVTESVTDSTTHVIAARWGTTKVHDARRRANIAIVNPRWLYACVERWEKADEKEFELTKETMNSKEKPLGGLVIDRQLSNMPTLAKETLRNMTDEVDEVLSEDDSGNEREEGVRQVADDGLGKSSSSKDGVLRKRKCNMREEGDEKREKNSAGTVSTSSSETSDSEVENMAADVERHFTSDDV
uniref:RNA polymerase II subunit A C-terminal domain phosphatase n=4 Tax=Parascaris univalens TaxID=6257 RepID=A0A915BLF5_PARUN